MSVKGLHKIIYPFAPDQSGAVSVLYGLGGMTIICDAGGCAGNICGFDEPRWVHTKSAIFSAGLRDMDAILGRDELLIEKIEKAAKRLDASFIAIIGTPVPATIATDYKALRRMAEKRTGLPVITADTNGALWYDDGIEKAYIELFKKFSPDVAEPDGVIKGSVGVIGAVPLDTGSTAAAGRIREELLKQGAENVICFGADGTVDDFKLAGRMERNIAVSVSGLGPARMLKEKYGTPYECCDPLIESVCIPFEDELSEICKNPGGCRTLIIHQQVRANALRDRMRKLAGSAEAEITVATWFRLDKEISEEGDIKLREEDDFFDLVSRGGYDVIFADASLRRAAKGFEGRFIELPHFAISGVPEE